jgi:hypothetical protein
MSCWAFDAYGLTTDEANRIPPKVAVDRDTIPFIRYDLGASTGYSRIQEGAITDWYGSLTLLPELYVGKFGIGLHADVRINTATGAIRREDFNSARDYLSLIYFARYGEEGDSGGYGRFGSIEEVSLGYGQFVDQYSNTVSLDDPMRGMVGEITTRYFRGSTLLNDFVSPGVFGGHASYYPFGIDPASALPQLAFGFSVAGDVNEEGALINPEDPGAPFLLPGSPGDPDQGVATGVRDGSLFMIGIDAGARWIQQNRFSLLTFLEGAKIFGYGTGASIGVQGTTDLGAAYFQFRYAQRFLSAHFLPDLFGPTYEAERLVEVNLPISSQSVRAVNTRRNELAGRQSAGIGHQVQMEFDYARAFESSVGYETIYGTLGSGRFHFDAELHAADFPVSMRIGYDRFRIDRLVDVLRASRENALYRLGLAYEVLGPVRIGLEASQSYETIYRNGKAAGRVKQNRVDPFIQVVLRL